MRRRSVTFSLLILFLGWIVIAYVLMNLAHKQTSQFIEPGLFQNQLNKKPVSNQIVPEHLSSVTSLHHTQFSTKEGRFIQSQSLPDHQAAQSPIAVLVIACNRPTVRRNLDQLLLHRKSAEKFPIIVSQDCAHAETANVIRTYGDKVTFIQQPDQGPIVFPNKKEEKFKGYYGISRHYRWALNQVFHQFNFSVCIVVEDDLDISPDFFEYFLATYSILAEDPSLWCVSAWNDNGKAGMIDESESQLLYRTDFFPGLGWMLEKKIWLELEPKWPASYWDDWMRQPDQRRDRSCLRPEIPRTSTFGKQGVSKGLFFDKHLKFIRQYEKFVPFTKIDLSYLLKDNYDEPFYRTVYGSPLMTAGELMTSNKPPPSVRLHYRDMEGFKAQAKLLGIMDDFKSGVARTAYRGIVTFKYKGSRVYLGPPFDWAGYNPKWN